MMFGLVMKLLRLATVLLSQGASRCNERFPIFGKFWSKERIAKNIYAIHQFK